MISGQDARAGVGRPRHIGIGDWVGQPEMAPIERTAYPRFKRLITARELHLFFSPSREELVWSQERADSEDHQLSLLLLLKSYQRMARFPKWDEIPGMVVDFVRKAVELPEGSVPGQYASVRTAEAHTSADCHHAHNQARDAARAVEFKRSSSPRFR